MTYIYLPYIMFSVTRQLQITKGNPQRLKEIRIKLGLSQSQLARELGVKTNTLARWERGYLVPPKVAELAAEYLLIKHRR